MESTVLSRGYIGDVYMYIYIFMYVYIYILEDNGKEHGNYFII